jgi:hypothetical protein
MTALSIASIFVSMKNTLVDKIAKKVVIGLFLVITVLLLADFE